MLHRRDRTGGLYFFTVVTAGRRPVFSDGEAVGALRESLRAERRERPFTVFAAVILPDHLHMNWSLPDGDADCSTRWRRIKGRVTAALGSGAGTIWQKRFWEHRIRDEDELAVTWPQAWREAWAARLESRPDDVTFHGELAFRLVLVDLVAIAILAVVLWGVLALVGAALWPVSTMLLKVAFWSIGLVGG